MPHLRVREIERVEEERVLRHAAAASSRCRRCVAMHVEGDSLLIGRHMHHSAFSLAGRYFSQSDEEAVGQ
jgi:hypothetical protein